MRGAGLACPGSELRDRLARFREAPLRLPQAPLSLALLFLEVSDQRLGLEASRLERGALGVRTQTLEPDDFALPYQTRSFLARACQLRLVRDGVLFLAMLLGEKR